MDNCPAHTSCYSTTSLKKNDVKTLMNCPKTPAFNIIETVFCDAKRYVRSKNVDEPEKLIAEFRNFLKEKVNEKCMEKRMIQSVKYLIKGLKREDM